MEHLSAEQLGRLRAALELEAQTLREGITASTAVVADSPKAEPGDIQDGAAHEADRFRAQQVLVHAQARLAEVDDALARMRAQSYGICEETDDEIPFRRLLLEPTTRYTVAALEELERTTGVRDPHPHETEGY